MKAGRGEKGKWCSQERGSQACCGVAVFHQLCPAGKCQLSDGPLSPALPAVAHRNEGEFYLSLQCCQLIPVELTSYCEMRSKDSQEQAQIQVAGVTCPFFYCLHLVLSGFALENIWSRKCRYSISNSILIYKSKCVATLSKMASVFFNKQIMFVPLPSARTHSVNRNNYFVLI